ncbi:erythromycin esterase family protein [Bacillus rugosus]|uniref:erythromycin esterase family protein n=1 Tax=Bacillus rugosus TaxID=2715209 RepID=UPI00142309F2|nr:erythromycin esterase family protein [Bacillus rugosus]NUF03625.1 erythromycin esterase family protein [Bacillus rugosus]
MKRLIVKTALPLLIVCLVFTSFSASARAASEEKHWNRWIEQHAHPLDSTDASNKDLRFLKKVLKGKRIVQLGETTHGAGEINATKVRMIKYLHEELGYDVLAFESGFTDTNASYLNTEQSTSKSTMKKSIYPVWHTEDVVELFDYMKEQKEKGDPLILTGFDIQSMKDSFNVAANQWVKAVNPKKAELLSQSENDFSTLVTDSSTFEEFTQKKEALVKNYQELIKFAQTHASALKAHLPKEPKAYEIFMHSLQLRIDVMETYMLEQMKEKLEDYPENIEDFSFFMRDRLMAEQFQWVAETLYPKKKIIVWGHNYHLRKQNTKMIKDWVQLNGPNMGDYLPERLKKQTYTIGIYAYAGASLDSSDNKTVKPVTSPPPPGSLEALLKATDHPAVFVDFLHTKNKKGTSWMYTPRTALYWGFMEEQMILKEQYDGVIWLDHITPAVIIK